MLILERREGESIRVGDNIEIKITSIDDKSVKVGINAPKELTIARVNHEIEKRSSQKS